MCTLVIRVALSAQVGALQLQSQAKLLIFVRLQTQFALKKHLSRMLWLLCIDCQFCSHCCILWGTLCSFRVLRGRSSCLLRLLVVGKAARATLRAQLLAVGSVGVSRLVLRIRLMLVICIVVMLCLMRLS